MFILGQDGVQNRDVVFIAFLEMFIHSQADDAVCQGIVYCFLRDVYTVYAPIPVAFHIDSVFIAYLEMFIQNNALLAFRDMYNKFIAFLKMFIHVV